ncbi:MAG: hypothetical protein IJP49_03835 [Bacteroidales bacterium]|nr:hypothetical protein [Bacteroidales bacterium]
MTGKYDDIIDLPHWDPKHHPRMSILDRAAQFAPFAALTGFEGVIDDTSRKVNANDGMAPYEDDYQQ